MKKTGREHLWSSFPLIRHLRDYLLLFLFLGCAPTEPIVYLDD